MAVCAAEAGRIPGAFDVLFPFARCVGDETKSDGGSVYVSWNPGIYLWRYLREDQLEGNCESVKTHGKYVGLYFGTARADSAQSGDEYHGKDGISAGDEYPYGGNDR